MQNYEVVTRSDFITFIRQLAEPAHNYAGSLEEYLRSVLRVVTPRHAELPAWRLLAQTFSDALITPPLPFDSAWLEHTTMPVSTRPSEFSDVRAMLCYQIADLHRMTKEGAINNPMRWLGITAAGSGSIWYNFEPASYLECASAGTNCEVGDEFDNTDCEWADLYDFLVAGQTYE
jgi:hypothetical protein